MKIQNIVSLVACGLIGTGLLPAHAVEDRLLGSSLAGLLEYAREHNPELAASRFEVEATLQRIEPAGALPDPVLRAELMDITNQGTNKDASLWPSQAGSTRYTLMQSVPRYGKRDLKPRPARSRRAGRAPQPGRSWWRRSSRPTRSITTSRAVRRLPAICSIW